MIRRQAMSVVALIGLFVALYMTLHKYGVVPPLPCTFSSCELVQASKWSMLLGFPVALWGVGYYAAVLTLAVLSTTDGFAESPWLPKALAAITGWGMVFSGWLSALEAFSIHGWCQYCLTSAALTVALFGLAAADFLASRAQGAPEPPDLRSPS